MASNRQHIFNWPHCQPLVEMASPAILQRLVDKISKWTSLIYYRRKGKKEFPPNDGMVGHCFFNFTTVKFSVVQSQTTLHVPPYLQQLRHQLSLLELMAHMVDIGKFANHFQWSFMIRTSDRN